MEINPEEDKPTDWFEPLYASSDIYGDGVPWANMSTHPYFEEWLSENPLNGKGKTAIVVGCGLGDDAIKLEDLGYDVVAFDVAESAILLCRKRFPNSKVDFRVADLFNYPPEWHASFDFVLEIYTVQALPPRYELQAIKQIAKMVKENGELLVITQVNESERDFDQGPPWLLNPDHRGKFSQQGLTLKKGYEISTKSGMNQVFFSLFYRK